MINLNDLAKKYGSDKHSDIHDYARLYEGYLFHLKHKEIKILEIGVFGGASLQMWRGYFPNAMIVGLDINPDTKPVHGAFIEIGDASYPGFINEVLQKYGKFDVIIDDGGHRTGQHVKSFQFLSRHLNPGGLYVIEDLHTMYWEEYQDLASTIQEVFVPVIDEVNMYGMNGYGNPYGPGAIKDTEGKGLAFYTKNKKSLALPWEFIHFYKSIVFMKMR